MFNYLTAKEMLPEDVLEDSELRSILRPFVHIQTHCQPKHQQEAQPSSFQAQIREQMSGPDLHVFTHTQIFSPKKTGFSPIKNTFHFFLTFIYLYSMQLFSADPKIFSKNF